MSTTEENKDLEPILEGNNENPEAEQEDQGIKIDDAKFEKYMANLKLEQNLPMALSAGMISAVVMAVIWAAVTVITNYQIGYMAIAVGLAVGFAVKFMGKGFDQVFGIIGGAFAFFGCLLGNFLSIVGFIADAEGMGYFETYALIDWSMIPDLMIDTFSGMDLLFYGIAIYEGYRFSFRQITEEEVIKHAAA
jgi:hypothetical protein